MGEGESIYLLCEPQSPLPQTAENNMYLAGLRGLGDPAGHRAQHTDPSQSLSLSPTPPSPAAGPKYSSSSVTLQKKQILVSKSILVFLACSLLEKQHDGS